MGIRLVPNPTFCATVHFTVLGQEAPEATLWEFRHKTPSDLQTWRAASGNLPIGDAMRDVVVRWVSGVVDDEGKDIPYSTDALDDFLSAHAPRGGELLLGYVNALSESRLKNLRRRHDD